MISGSTPAPALAVSTVPITTAVRGKRSTAATPQAMPTPTPASNGMPGSRENMIPAATPRNIAGNVGPPRKLPNESE